MEVVIERREYGLGPLYATRPKKLSYAHTEPHGRASADLGILLWYYLPRPRKVRPALATLKS